MWLWLTLLGSGILLTEAMWWWRCHLLQTQLEERTRENKLLRAGYEQALAQAQTQFEALLNSIDQGLLLLEPGGRIQIANHAFHSLFRVDKELKGRTVIEVIRLPELPGLSQRLREE
jgi:PAS domain-containing protein